MGIDNLMQFDFMSSPPSACMVRALELLYALGALDEHAKLTHPLGTQLAEFPVDPILAKLIFTSGQMGCSEEMVSIVAMVQVQSVFVAPRGAQAKADAARLKFAVYEGDHLTLLNVYNAFIKSKQDPKWCHERYINFKAMKRAYDIRQQLVKYMRKYHVPLQSCAGDATTLRKCLVAGYFSHAARRHADGTYRTVRGKHALEIHPNSVLFKFPPEWVIFHETVLTTKEYMREVTSIDANWLTEMAPHFYEMKTLPPSSTSTSASAPPPQPATAGRLMDVDYY
jgi:ATP-dependent RNA helicase DDX35